MENHTPSVERGQIEQGKILKENKFGETLQNIGFERAKQWIENIGIELSEQDLKIIEKISFENIDIEDPENQCHLDILASLFQSKKGNKNIHRIMSELEINSEVIEKIAIEKMKLEDISLEMGTRRNVDHVEIGLKDKVYSFTVSIDRRPLEETGRSESLEEAKVLAQLSKKHIKALQRYFGSSKINRKGKRGVIFKEYLSGYVLENFTALIGTEYEKEKKDLLSKIALSCGEMIGEFYKETKSLPQDLHGLNIIINEEEEEIISRLCDVSGLAYGPREILHELSFLFEEFRHFESNIIKGFTKATSPEIFRELLLSLKDLLEEKTKEKKLSSGNRKILELIEKL